MPAAQELVVCGGAALSGTARLPGDKSISHRVLMLSAVADGETHLNNVSSCRDVLRTVKALQVLGVEMVAEANGRRSPISSPGGSARPEPGDSEPAPAFGAGAISVRGRGPSGLGAATPVAVVIDCGDSGTTMRLLAGLLVGQGRAFRLSGSEQLRRRPMLRLVEPLRSLGADIAAAPGGGAPLVGGMGGGSGQVGLRAAEVVLEHASAQVGSAVLLAGLRAVGETVVRYPSPVRDHTERMLADMGAPIRWSSTSSHLEGPVGALAPPRGGVYRVPGDPSAAAFLLAAATIVPGSRVELPDLNANPGRTGFIELLARMGADVVEHVWGMEHGEPLVGLTARHGDLTAAGTVGGALVPRMIDELPLLAVLATRAHGRTELVGAEELRAKESDRIDAVVSGLRSMGAHIEERPDGFAVDGPAELVGARVDGRGDHRIVMALAVAGLAARGETRIAGGERTADSFPGFAETLAALGADVTLEPAATQA